MKQSTEEQMSQRQEVNDISSGDSEMLSDISADESDNIDQSNFVAQSKYDFNSLKQQVAFEEMKHQDINLRERVSTTQLIKEVISVNESIKANQTGSRGIANPIKLLVSKQKRRYNLNGFNLDLTYITERIIAMGFPAGNVESVYRNSMEDVQRFFNLTHPNHYKIYNLCSERKYNHNNFQNSVAEFPFEDHQAPTFGLIYEFCVDLDNWFKKDDRNVAGIHCKAGKGRTGVMICCYMLFRKQFLNAYDSMRYYGMIRTKNRKGVTIPSQIRYIFYFEKGLNNLWVPDNMPNKEVQLVKIKLIPVPNYNVLGGCEPWFRIQNREDEYNSKKQIKLKQYKIEPFIEFKLEGVYLKGDVLLQFYNNSFMKKNDKMFQLWFNCDFFGNSGVVMIDKFMLDKACKDKGNNKFQKDFRIELHTVENLNSSFQQQNSLSPGKLYPNKLGF